MTLTDVALAETDVSITSYRRPIPSKNAIIRQKAINALRASSAEPSPAVAAKQEFTDDDRDFDEVGEDEALDGVA